MKCWVKNLLVFVFIFFLCGCLQERKVEVKREGLPYDLEIVVNTLYLSDDAFREKVEGYIERRLKGRVILDVKYEEAERLRITYTARAYIFILKEKK